MSYYDDNFGHWTMDGDEDRAFYRTVQRASVVKTCSGCGRKVRILPHYAYCNSCADAIERGGEF
jgi:hypothetical protein